MPLPPDHPLRLALNDEAHARPPEALSAPLRLTYLAVFLTGEQRDDAWRCVARLAAAFGAVPPSDGTQHYTADLGRFRLKCERHTEFLRFTFIVDGGDADDPFANPAIAAVPDGWLETLPGQLIVACNVTLVRAGDAPIDFDEVAARAFDGNVLIGGGVAAGAGIAVTDFRIHADGYSRVLVFDRTMTPRQAGRMVQRLMEIDTYRILSLMTLPIARALGPMIARSERELAQITRSLVEMNQTDETPLFERLTRLEAEIESAQAEHVHRFSAADAYDRLVNSRIAELREERIVGLQTFREFTERRLAPAMNTCRTVARQLESLSERLARVTELLSTRVGITREGQSQKLLESMDRRSEIALRLQETVEGLSIAAITYYIVGLIGYFAKGVKAAGVHLDVEVVTGLSIPIVLVLVALGLRRIKSNIASRHG